MSFYLHLKVNMHVECYFLLTVFVNKYKYLFIMFIYLSMWFYLINHWTICSYRPIARMPRGPVHCCQLDLLKPKKKCIFNQLHKNNWHVYIIYNVLHAYHISYKLIFFFTSPRLQITDLPQIDLRIASHRHVTIAV